MISLSPMIQTYRVIVHKAEEGGYWGEVLELPGCVSQGETLEEFNQNIREAIDAVLHSDLGSPHAEFQMEPTLAEKDTLQFSAREPFESLVGQAEASETWTAVQ